MLAYWTQLDRPMNPMILFLVPGAPFLAGRCMEGFVPFPAFALYLVNRKLLDPSNSNSINHCIQDTMAD